MYTLGWHTIRPVLMWAPVAGRTVWAMRGRQMTSRIARGIVLALILVGAACSSGDNTGDAPHPTQSETSSQPDKVILQVDIHDQVPLDVYFNGSRSVCTSVNIGDLLNQTKTPRVQIVVRDADGKIVGTEAAPKFGGHYSQTGGCTVPWRITVPASEFYEVEVSGGAQPISHKATVQTKDGGVTSVSVEF